MSNQYQLRVVISALDRLSPKIREIKSGINRLRIQMRSATEGALPSAAAIGGVIGLSARNFAIAEKAATNLKVSMMQAGGSVPAEFQKISALATELGGKLPGNTADFQSMMSALIQQGIPARSILEGVGRAAAYLSIELEQAPDQAAEFAAKLQDATKTASADMFSLMDLIQRAKNMGVRSDDQLEAFSGLTSTLTLIRQNGLLGANTLAPLVVMLDQAGVKGETAGNALRKIFQAGLDLKKVSQANAMLKGKGISLDFTDGNGEFGGLPNLFAQLDKLKSLKATERGSVFGAIFGNDSEVSKALDALQSKGISGYQQSQSAMMKQAGLEDRVNARLGTLSGLMDAASGNITNASSALGEQLSPELKKASMLTGEAGSHIQRLIERFPNLTRGLAFAALAFSGVRVAALGLAIGLKVIGLLLATNPIVRFIQILAIAAGLLYAAWGPVTKFISASWENIKRQISGFSPLDVIQEKWQPIVGFFKELWSDAQGYIEPLLGSAPGVAPNATADGRTPIERQARAGQNALVRRQAESRSNAVGGEIDVRFHNAPPGTRVNQSSKQGGAQIRTDVGYNRFAKS